MRDVIYALMLLFPQPDGSAIGIPLGRDFDWNTCQQLRSDVINSDAEILGVVLCVDQRNIELPPLPTEKEVG